MNQFKSFNDEEYLRSSIEDLFGESIPQIEKTTTKTKEEIKLLLVKLQSKVSKKDKEDDSFLKQMYYFMTLSPDFDERVKTAENYFNEAAEFYNLNDYKRAFELFSKSIELYPNENAYYSRGVVAMDLDDFNRAIIDATSAIVFDKKYVNAYHNRALCFLTLLNMYDLMHEEDCSTVLDFARQDLKMAISLGHQSSEVYLQKTYVQKDSKPPFYIVELNEFRQIINSNAIFKIWEQQITEKVEGPFSMARSSLRPTHFTGKYHFLFQSDITEKNVGVSEDSTNVFNVPWELVREDGFNGENYIIFSGWGDQMNGGYSQFENYEIGVEKSIISSLIEYLIIDNPDYFSITKMKNVIGLEKLDL